jgi:hypothetical protein
MRRGIILVALVSALLAPFAPAASATQHAVPAGVAAMCKRDAVFCSGYWTTVGGSTVYMIGTPVTVGSGGTVRPAGTMRPATVQGWHTLNNHGTGLCMTSLGASADGSPAEDWGCNGSANQTWDIFANGAPGYTVFGFINRGDALCLNNRWGSTATYNIETLWACDTGSMKQWYFFYSGSLAAVQKIGPVGNSGMCLSSLGYTLYGSDIYLFPCNDSPNQWWGNVTPG